MNNNIKTKRPMAVFDIHAFSNFMRCPAIPCRRHICHIRCVYVPTGYCVARCYQLFWHNSAAGFICIKFLHMKTKLIYFAIQARHQSKLDIPPRLAVSRPHRPVYICLCTWCRIGKAISHWIYAQNRDSEWYLFKSHYISRNRIYHSKITLTNCTQMQKYKWCKAGNTIFKILHIRKILLKIYHHC